MISYYRLKARTVRTIMHLFDLLANSWLQYRNHMMKPGASVKDTLQFHEFRMDVAEAWIASESPLTNSESDEEDTAEENEEQPRKKRRIVSQPSEHARASGVKHLPKMMSQKNASRCRNNGCNGKTKVQCTMCVSVKRDCFYDFHSN